MSSSRATCQVWSAPTSLKESGDGYDEDTYLINGILHKSMLQTPSSKQINGEEVEIDEGKEEKKAYVWSHTSIASGQDIYRGSFTTTFSTHASRDTKDKSDTERTALANEVLAYLRDTLSLTQSRWAPLCRQTNSSHPLVEAEQKAFYELVDKSEPKYDHIGLGSVGMEMTRQVMLYGDSGIDVSKK
ncbi:hypothetical protein L198_07790 [Cryptococcus wingfieldii CBS 7118]|uniref:Uncharacterized protein n=1 Tax=Cryptococcus wingfieldii CBS 7118 TaxID=1295528 RepID=A0A1E3HY99_9TREE|nr:hypothetical protein L198_07790 [Cryptococcus wingfieldii CBS 7118]ODN81304.1 hypothetical protein L198_07790 [Cryptococcus wingfieldii CBS 7118]